MGTKPHLFSSQGTVCEAYVNEWFTYGMPGICDYEAYW